MGDVFYEVKNHAANIVLNRPEVMNAFNYNLLLELEKAVEAIRVNENVRIVTITGAGEKAFSVGADLKERKSLTHEQVRRNLYKIGEVFSKIEQLPQPTIAVLNGYAFGGGLELALSCDFRIAVDNTLVGLTETSLAIIPGAGGTQRLPRLIGESKALELILTARKLTSAEANTYGLFTRMSDSDNLQESVRELSAAILQNGPIAVRQAKFSVKEGMKADLQTGLQIEQKAYELTLPTEDRKEALEAFNEKRSPNYKGK